MNLKLLTIICSTEYEKKIYKICKKNNISVSIDINAKGTATSSILNYFGIAETNKTVLLSIIPDYLETSILREINQKLKMHQVGVGIAFTISLTSANKFLIDSYKIQTQECENMSEKKYHLVMTIVLEGNLEKVMQAAKKAGAQGGTVIRGRGLGNKEAKKIFGFEIEPGRDIVLNVVDENIKTKVMEKITKAVGVKTESKGICISLPIDNAVGIIETDKAINQVE